MSKKIVAFVFPGQGAQYPGMGKDFFESSPEAKEVFQKADDLLGYPFSELIFNGPTDQLTQTKNSQLAIFITSMAILRAFQAEVGDLVPAVSAGLSLGEYTALCAAGILSFEEALMIVKARGAYMQEACEKNPGTMHVVLGMDLAIVEEVLSGINGAWVANLNCPGQIVISGTVSGVDSAANLLKEKGARRILPLDVSGAFHSGLMNEAQERLSPMIHDAALHSSDVKVVMNVKGEVLSDEADVRKAMVDQVTHSVLWQKSVETMVEEGVDLFIEMGPGNSLAGMNKRIGVIAPTVSIEKKEDLDGAIKAVQGEIHASS